MLFWKNNRNSLEIVPKRYHITISMMRIGKLTDYGVAIICSFVKNKSEKPKNAKELSNALRLPIPTVSKVLKILCRAGLLDSVRGISGGYRLSKDAKTISLGEVIELFENKIAITDCGRKKCGRETICFLKDNWKIIGDKIRLMLFDRSIDDFVNGKGL